MADLLESATPAALDLGLEELLAAASSAFAGERVFIYLLDGREFRFTYCLDASSEMLLGVRRKAAELAKLTPSAMPPAWRPFAGEEGIGADIATRVAWAQQAKCALKGAPLSTLDLLRLSHVAGPLFVLLTEEVAVAASGALSYVETEAIEALGEDSPPTISGSSS